MQGTGRAALCTICLTALTLSPLDRPKQSDYVTGRAKSYTLPNRTQYIYIYSLIIVIFAHEKKYRHIVIDIRALSCVSCSIVLSVRRGIPIKCFQRLKFLGFRLGSKLPSFSPIFVPVL